MLKMQILQRLMSINIYLLFVLIPLQIGDIRMGPKSTVPYIIRQSLVSDDKSKANERLTQRNIFKTIFRQARTAFFRLRCH